MVKCKIFYGHSLGGPLAKWFASIDLAVDYFKTNGHSMLNFENKENEINFMWFENNNYEGFPVIIYKQNG